MRETLEYLHYDPDTGIFTWTRKTSAMSRVLPGQVAGTVNSDGYMHVTVLGKVYKLHRLAWFHYYGVEPVKYIDHVNHVTTDNRIVNLREATPSENCQNRYTHVSNKLGVKGLSVKHTNGYDYYRAQITLNSGKRVAKNFKLTNDGLLQACEWLEVMRSDHHEFKHKGNKP